jgi:hypothetical protein
MGSSVDYRGLGGCPVITGNVTTDLQHCLICLATQPGRERRRTLNVSETEGNDPRRQPTYLTIYALVIGHRF